MTAHPDPTPGSPAADGSLTCRICGHDLEGEDCWKCGGEGYFDLYEEDPINYAPDEEYEPCEECHGRGVLLICPYVEGHAEMHGVGGSRE